MAKFEVAAALLGDNSEYNPFFAWNWWIFLTGGWMECLDHPILENVDNRPVHDILYSILNVNLSKTIVPIALELDQTNFGEKEITSAIKWFQKQGLF